jgi:drug/metabolite transporter (DMT)-like permease
VTNKPLKRSAYLPFAALALLALTWGYNWVVMKVAVRDSDPFTFAALRNLLGALALFAVVAVRGGSLRPKVFWWTALFGLFQTGTFGLSVWALYVGSAGRTSVLTYTMPFWLLFMAWPVLGERIRGAQWAAVVLALAGFVFVLDPWSLRGLQASLLAAGGGLGWAIASLLFKIIRKRHEIELLPFTAWQALVGTIPLIVVALLVDKEGPTWSASFIGALAYNVIAGSAIAWLLWLYVLHNLPAGTAGLSSLAIPVVGVTAAWVQLGERPGALEAVGMGLIVAALAILTARGLYISRQTQPSEPLPSGVERGVRTPGADEPPTR